MTEAVVFGNVTLDVLCQTVDDVPRYESVSFDRVVLSPGGCASNVAVGLAALGVDTSLVCKTGEDVSGEILRKTWSKFNLDLSYVRSDPNVHTAVSVGLVDRDAQPRFVHTPGANGRLTIDDFPHELFDQKGIKVLHIAGFFVLPGLLDEGLGQFLEKAHHAGWIVTLDVVNSKRYWKPEYLFPCLKEVDIFLCNRIEAMKLTGADTAEESAQLLRREGAKVVVIKAGGEGCYLYSDDINTLIPSKVVDVVDTTGAGDAFAAGMIAALISGKNLVDACEYANVCGANVVQHLGTITYWERLLGEKNK
ncbi:MAG: sugar kinase [Anaerolineales bacterium]